MASTDNKRLSAQDAPQVPADLPKLIYRLASLPRGHVYQLTVVVPEATTAERFWTVQPAGKVENLR